MSQVNLDGTPKEISTDNDSIVIKEVLIDIPGGKSLDVSGYTPTDVIKAGHIIIEETATGELKPLNVTDDEYVSLPSLHTYKGVLIATVLKSKPLASVMLSGDVNEAASPYPVPSGAKTALTHILFTQD
ncbi:hypothetical protein [Flavobacterium sp. 102]|uniref:hypothetical protein n=1 Tax=Flavobacterium sp. 102 TaxID=2135623 RepID=UPI000EB10B05|nr:hypothetical protein [Flavobacterium sp. 102]RKS00421.1 hypothetical protein C8C84_0029 [Flavobacterium sp. 102]